MTKLNVTCDWHVNAGRPRIQVVLLLLRLAQRVPKNTPALFRRAISGFYRVVALNIMAIDIPVPTQIGPRLRIHHGFGLVINSASEIGSDVELRHNITIGSRKTNSDCPKIGDNVSVGPQTVIMGSISIGSNARVGAGSVVLSDVHPGASVAGSPARTLRSEENKFLRRQE